MIKKILLLLAAVIAVILVVAAFRPTHFSIQRSTAIAAPAALVYAQVNNLHTWQDFSPWTKLDPNAKISYAGPVEGTGAVFAWSGNSDVGEGKMTITESRPAEAVRFRLDFVKPMEGTSNVEFAFKQAGGQTTVTWTMSGENNYLARIMCLFMNMDKMVGGQFEQGLASLKTLSEAAVKK